MKCKPCPDGEYMPHPAWSEYTNEYRQKRKCDEGNHPCFSYQYAVLSKAAQPGFAHKKKWKTILRDIAFFSFCKDKSHRMKEAEKRITPVGVILTHGYYDYDMKESGITLRDTCFHHLCPEGQKLKLNGKCGFSRKKR